MTDVYLDKLLNEICDISRETTIAIAPHYVNEPFMDSRLLEILKRVDKQMSRVKVSLFTNGSLLYEREAKELSQIGKISAISVSLNEYEKAPYTRVTGLSFEKTIKNIKYLHGLAEKGQLKTEVYIRRVGDGSASDQEFVEFVKREFPLFIPACRRQTDWIGQIGTDSNGNALVKYPLGFIPVMGCNQWFRIHISSEGKAYVCCFDGVGKWPVADLNNMHILDFYRSKYKRMLRKDIYTRLEAPPPCNSCNIYWNED